jgi:hypothetical protein
MATLDITFTAGTQTGALLRRLAKAIELQAGNCPDVCGSGASSVLRFDNAPATGNVSVQLVSGPYATSAATLV